MYRFQRGILMAMSLVLLLSVGCDTRTDHSEDIAAIYKILELRQKAVGSKDLALYESIIFSGYSSRGVKREMVLDDFKLTLQRIPELSLRMPRIRPDVKRNSARIAQSSFYRTGADKPAVQIKETLMFRKIEGHWFISEGIVLGLSSKLKI
jgi:hypothetical protein